MSLIYFIFLLSGACGLAYEVVWTRTLELAVGHTIYAITAVLAAFMGGLAGGSAYFGRRVEAGSDPLRLYAGLEAGVAVLACVFPLQLRLVGAASVAAAPLVGTHILLLTILRFLLACAALLPATFLMGGTLPVLVTVATGPHASFVDRRAGFLYAVNTAGAVCGATAAGFLLIERFGTWETTWIAAAGNLGVAAVALALRSGLPVAPAVEGSRARSRAQADRRPSKAAARPLFGRGRRAHAINLESRVTGADARGVRGSEGRPAGAGLSGPRAPEGPADDRAVLWMYAWSGFSALALELIWTRALVFFAGTTTYAFTSMVVVFLAGITLGSAAGSSVSDRLPRPRQAFGVVEALVAVAAAASLRLLTLAAPAIDGIWPPDRSWVALVCGNFAKAALAMALPTVLFGATFPLAVRLYTGASDALRQRDGGHPAAAARLVGRLYAANTVGGIAGAIAGGFLLIPLLGIDRALLAASGVNVCIAMAALWTPEAAQGAARLRAVRLASPAVAAVAVFVLTARPQLLHRAVGSERLIFYEEGNTATISVLEEVTGTRTLYIDRVPVAGTDLIMLTDQKSLAHVPMLLHPSATRVLTVGLGSGGASWSFSRYRQLRQIDCVEIDPSVFRAAPFLEASNHAVWRDPRFRLILEDARSYLAATRRDYDVISTDCTDLRYKSNATLYTVDYFTLCRRRLRPGGLVTVWMPLGGLGDDTFRMALRTFLSVFPRGVIWYMNNLPTHYLLLVGSDEPVRLDLDAIRAAVADPAVRADLAEIRLDDPRKLASCLLLDEQGFARLAADAPLNTDRHPLLEFRAPRLAYRDALVRNLRAAAALRGEAPAPVRDAPPAVAAALRPYAAAAGPLIEGHAIYQRGTFDYPAALRCYRRALAANPADRSIPSLLADLEQTRAIWLAEFERRTAAGSRDPRDWLALATLDRQVGRYPQAVDAARRAVDLEPGSAEARVKLAAAMSAGGDVAGSLAMLEQARRRVPDDTVVLTDLAAALNEAGKFDAASALLRRAVVLAPGAADARNNLGVALNGLGQPAQAAAELETAIRLNPASPEAWFNLGVSRASLGRLDEARAAYRAGLNLAPGEPRALFNLALIEEQAGRLDRAEARYREAIGTPGGTRAETAQARNELARLYLRAGQPARAVAELIAATEDDPRSAPVRYNLALAYEMLRQPALAADAYRAAIDLDPTFGEAYERLGRAYLRERRLQDARATFRAWLRIDPRSALARRLLDEAEAR